jgi:hypothetical protein
LLLNDINLHAARISGTPMKPISSPTEEIRAIRHSLAAKFRNDLHRIIGDLCRQQRESGKEYVRLPKRTPAVNLGIKTAE